MKSNLKLELVSWGLFQTRALGKDSRWGWLNVSFNRLVEQDAGEGVNVSDGLPTS